MRIGGHGELENLRKSLMREDPARTPRPGKADETGQQGGKSDEVQLSSEARVMGKLGRVADVRTERVEQIKAEVKSGTYVTRDKLHNGIRKMLRDF
jgi:anti-sigma28 factor (negative regulator of flagellin synthesis)